MLSILNARTFSSTFTLTIHEKITALHFVSLIKRTQVYLHKKGSLITLKCYLHSENNSDTLVCFYSNCKTPCTSMSAMKIEHLFDLVLDLNKGSTSRLSNEFI